MSPSKISRREPEWVLHELERLVRQHHPNVAPSVELEERVFWPLGLTIQNGIAREIDFWNSEKAASTYEKFLSKIEEASMIFSQIPLAARMQIVDQWREKGGDESMQRSLSIDKFQFMHFVHAVNGMKYTSRAMGTLDFKPTLDRNSQNSRWFKGYATIHEARKLWASLRSSEENEQRELPPQRPSQGDPFFSFLCELFEAFSIEGDVESACRGYSKMLKNIGAAAEDPQY